MSCTYGSFDNKVYLTYLKQMLEYENIAEEEMTMIVLPVMNLNLHIDNFTDRTQQSKRDRTEIITYYLPIATIKLTRHLSVMLYFPELSPAEKSNLMFIFVPCLPHTLNLFFLTFIMAFS